MATPSTTTAPLVCDVCWKKDGCLRNGKTGLRLLRCKQCGVCVHTECYGWTEPLGEDDSAEFCCWACLAVGTVVKVRERDPETGKRKQIRITKRPTECCLCSVDEGMDVPHAMHPVFDDSGLRARQILLPAEKQGAVERAAWAHTICCMVLASSTGGVVYGLTRAGAFDGDDDHQYRIQDDESINSDLGDEKCKSAETVTHFGHILERFYKKGSLYLKHRKEYQSLKCIDCGANDQANNVYRIPIQCVAGDKKEHSDFHGCHSDLGTDTCYQAMHVGCAFYGKNEQGEYPAVRRVYYFPGHKDEHARHNQVVANCFCLKHAEDVSTVFGCGSTKYPKGSKKAPRLYNHKENAQSTLLYLKKASQQMEPPPQHTPGTVRQHHSSADSNTKPQSSQRRPSPQQPQQSKRRHSQQQQQQHPKRSPETRAKNVSNPSSSVSSLFFSNNVAAAAVAPATSPAGDSDFEKLVAELRKKISKKERTITKKKWLRNMANWSSDKFNSWWDRALERSKEPPCETSTSKSASSPDVHHDGKHHLGEEDHHLQRPSYGCDEKLKQEMIQAVSDAVAQLGDDKKKDPELVRKTVHEKRVMFRKQQDSMSKADFNSLWKDVREKVGHMYVISIPPFKKRNSEQQQGTRKLPPEMANAIAAAAAAATAGAGGEPPMEKQKLEPQQLQQQQDHVETNGSMTSDPKQSVGDQKAASTTSFLATGIDMAASSTSPNLQTRVESKNNHDVVVNDEKQAESSMDDEEPAKPLTIEQIRFQNMVQDVDDESVAHRQQVPLQVILKKQRQHWENHLVKKQGRRPMHNSRRLSDMEFASLWQRVERRACENWQHRIQTSAAPVLPPTAAAPVPPPTADAAAPMDWNFLVFGQEFDEKKATTYCNEWDTTMNSDEI